MLFLLCGVCFASGCSKETGSSEYLNFTYKDTETTYDDNTGIQPAEVPFLSEQLVVLPEEEPIELSSEAALLINLTEKESVYSFHAYDEIYPASITKLMTALLAFEYGAMYETVTISDTASDIGYSGARLCGFKSGDTILLEDLLASMLVYSGNDASVAIAEHIAGSEEAFVEQMNRRATELGAVSTHFSNSHGLPADEHVTTAYDTYLIMNELFHYDKFLSVISKTVFTASYKTAGGGTVSKTFHSSNGYFNGNYTAPAGIEILGGKTGTTEKSGYCLSMFVKDSGGTVYIAELFGADSSDELYQDMNRLLGGL